VLNHDGYSVRAEHGVPQVFELAATEKLYGDYQLTLTNKGGHSSLPRPDNAIYQLARDLLKLAAYQFPFELNNVTRAYFERLAESMPPAEVADLRAILKTPPDPAAIARLGQQPAYGSVMRTTCVATRLEGGHANNALPQRARANINCRILPGHSLEEVRQELIKVLADPELSVRYMADDGVHVFDTAPERRGFSPPPLVAEVGKPLEALVRATWPGLKVVPFMDAGASDAVYTSAAGLPTYGVSGIAIDSDDVRAHGRDERVGTASFYTGNQFFYRYLKAISAP
jgi:acetylornithine deacetylase/succinyl-diaminopimelate desuccinylase-like protein